MRCQRDSGCGAGASHSVRDINENCLTITLVCAPKTNKQTKEYKGGFISILGPFFSVGKNFLIAATKDIKK